MRYFNLLKMILCFIVVWSCTITRKIKIEQVSEATIANYYEEKDIPLSDIIRVKDVASYTRLSDLGFAEIPKVIIFTDAGKQIDYEQIDYCVADPVEFIKGYRTSSEELKLKDFSLQGYLANFAAAILIESGLSFLGIGAQPPMASWGAMIKEHYNYIILGKPYLALIPGICIMLLVMAFTLVGNALRDALDVKT